MSWSLSRMAGERLLFSLQSGEYLIETLQKFDPCILEELYA